VEPVLMSKGTTNLRNQRAVPDLFEIVGAVHPSLTEAGSVVSISPPAQVDARLVPVVTDVVGAVIPSFMPQLGRHHHPKAPALRQAWLPLISSVVVRS
jgi:hypothetical protein